MTPQNNSNHSEIDTIVSFFLQHNFVEANVMRGLSLLKTFFEQYYFIESNDKIFEAAIEKLQELENVSQADLQFIETLFQEHRAFFPRDSFYQALNDLGNALYSLPRLVLYIPIRLDHESLGKIGTWVRDNISQKVLISTRIDPQLIAGCGIVWNNQRIEFSFEQQVKNSQSLLFSVLPKL